MSLLRQLHAASLPFVARALRGGRRLRYSVGALLLAALTVLLGFWIALGPGRLEHELRAGFNLERPMYMQELVDNKIFVDDEAEVRALTREVDVLMSPATLRQIADGSFRRDGLHDWCTVSRLESSVEVLGFAANSATHDRVQVTLQSQARGLQQQLGLPQSAGYTGEWMHWYNEDDEARIRGVLASQLRPTVAVYSSPLGVPDAIRLTGIMAGGLILVLFLLFAPILAGTQMAQEVHENTLQPLTGTALNARDLVLGMTVGPLTIIALLAAPQVVLLLGATLAAGGLAPALGMLAVAVAGGLFLTMLAQLAGLALGRQRTPGLIGVALLGVLVPLTILGTALAIDLPSRATGMLALLPQAGSAYLLFESLVPASADPINPFHVEFANDVGQAHFAAFAGLLGMLCFAYLGLRALERRVGDLAPTALTRFEALGGALVSIFLITLANPWRDYLYNPGEFYFLNFVLVLAPAAILLMMRVPQGDTPLALRRVPVGSLVAEFAAMIGLFFAVTVAVMGVRHFDMLYSPVALAYTAWTVVVAALLAVRVAALPSTLLAKLWLGVCSVGLIAAIAHASEWSRHPNNDFEHLFALGQVSPLLGILQVVLLVLIPVSLVRALRNPAAAAPVDG
jgi:hypothetical protein